MAVIESMRCRREMNVRELKSHTVMAFFATHAHPFWFKSNIMVS